MESVEELTVEWLTLPLQAQLRDRNAWPKLRKLHTHNRDPYCDGAEVFRDA